MWFLLQIYDEGGKGLKDEDKEEKYKGKMCANCIRYYCKRQNKKNIGSIDCCNEYLFRKKHYLAGLIEGRKENKGGEDVK